MDSLNALIADVDKVRPKTQDRAKWRRATVTHVRTSPTRAVRTSRTGAAWIRYPVWWSPAVGVTVELLISGNDAMVINVLA